MFISASGSLKTSRNSMGSDRPMSPEVREALKREARKTLSTISTVAIVVICAYAFAGLVTLLVKGHP